MADALDRVADARTWLEEFFGRPEDLADGAVRMALAELVAPPAGREWSELQGFRPRRYPVNDLDHAGMLDVLAMSAVVTADKGHDVYVCPYAHPGRHRSKGGAVARRHVHADIDGPLDLARVRFVGGIAVASGSVDADGKPHGHVYDRLNADVPPYVQEALCAGLGEFLSREYWDESKVADNDVLRLPGTLNYKTDPPRPVSWLVRPDDPAVKTWAPEDLACLLGLGWPIPEPSEEPAELEHGARGRPGSNNLPSDVRRRLDGLARAVTDAPAGDGNSTLNWAAGKAAGIVITMPGAPEAAEVRAALVAAYLARPNRDRKTETARRSEAEATAASGWKWGGTHPGRALTDSSSTTTATRTPAKGDNHRKVHTTDPQRKDDHDVGDETSPETGAGPVDPETGEVRPSWRPVDLAATVAGLQDGTLKRLRPTVGELSLTDDEKRFLLYRGKVNGVAGESGCGKTWTGLKICAQEITQGRPAVYVDLEDDHISVVTRLLAMGADPDDVLLHFHYVSPVEWMRDPDWDDLSALLDEVSPSLVVVDSVGEGLSMAGANPNADEEVALWFRKLPRRLSRHQTAPAVLVLDHTTKAASDGLWPIGSQRKRAAITGVQYMQRMLRPFKRGKAGSAVLVCAKDRLGNYAIGEKVAELHLAPTGDADGVGIDLVSVVGRTDDDTCGGPDGDEKPMDKTRREAASRISGQVIAYVTKHPGKSTHAVETALRKAGVRFRNGAVADSLSIAEECSGVVCRRTGSGTYWGPYEPAGPPEDEVK